MPNYRFVVNLRAETAKPHYLDTLEPWGFLLAPRYGSAGIRQVIRDQRAKRKVLFVDNGNFTLIEQTAAEFEDRLAPLLARVAGEERRLGHKLRRGEASPPLREQLTSVARAVAERVAEQAGDGDRRLPDQIALDGTHLIGVEDPTPAVLLRLNLEPEYLSLTRRDYRKINDAVARRAVERIEQLDRKRRSHYYPVASAVSYQTAYDAGKVFAQRGLQNVAMGFGAFMSDRNDTDFVEIAGRRRTLPAPLPNRYVRSGAVARGFWDGYTDEAGKPPVAFHFLGLGAPIMVGLAGLYSWGTQTVTFDATSPIRDAFAGALYVSKPSFLKIDTSRFASQLASGQREEWKCPCPFCRAFTNAHPFDYPAGRAWYATENRDARDADLRLGNPLFGAYPLLSQPSAGQLWSEVRIARVGHNHWALDQITASLRSKRSRTTLERMIGSVVERYESSARSDKYRSAITLLYEIATAPGS